MKRLIGVIMANTSVIAANAPLSLRLARLFKEPPSFLLIPSTYDSRRAALDSASFFHATFLDPIMSSSRKSVLAANGFGRGSFTVAEAWALYHTRYPVPPDMRLPSSGGWRMAVNKICVPPLAAGT